MTFPLVGVGCGIECNSEVLNIKRNIFDLKIMVNREQIVFRFTVTLRVFRDVF